MTTLPNSPIGPEQAALITGRVSIIVGSRDAQLRPHLMRSVGCRLAADHRSLVLLMPASGSEALLEDLRGNGQIAVVFSQPSTHRTLQLKGSDAVVEPATPDDAVLAEQYLQGFIEEIGQLGLAAEVAHTMLRHDGQLLALRFSVASAFEQTPGPAAGRPLGAAP